MAICVATLLAVLAHGLGGGTVATSCSVLLVALCASAITTSGAAVVAQRTRGSSAALATLTLGQLVTETVLSFPADHLPSAALPAAGLHGVAVLAVGALLMGASKTFRPLVRIVRRCFRRRFRVGALPFPPERVEPPTGPWRIRAGLLEGHGPRVPRGPPVLSVAPLR